MPAATFARPRERAAFSPALLSALSEKKVAQSAVEVARHELQQTPIDLVSSLIDAQLRFLALSGELDSTFQHALRPQ